jgi:hypothetical protein
LGARQTPVPRVRKNFDICAVASECGYKLIEADKSAKSYIHDSHDLLSNEEIQAMTITISINAVGSLRATEIIQSARADAAREHQTVPRLVSVDIGRSVDAEAQETGASRPLPASQNRAVDILV